MKKLTVLIVAVWMLWQVSGCAAFNSLKSKDYRGDTSRDIQTKKLALMINDSLRRPAIKNREVGVLTFVNLNDLEKSDPLGRHLQEKLTHALFDLGFRVVEIRTGELIRFVPKTGELNLTRLKEKLKNTPFKDLKTLVFGTYVDAGDYIYVNARCVELETRGIRASGEIKIPKGEYLRKLLQWKDSPFNKKDVYERFPNQAEKSK